MSSNQMTKCVLVTLKYLCHLAIISMAVFLLCCLFSKPRPVFFMMGLCYVHSFIILANLSQKTFLVKLSNFIWLVICLFCTLVSRQASGQHEIGGLTDYDAMTQQFSSTPEEKVNFIFFSSLLCLAIVLFNAINLILIDSCLKEMKKAPTANTNATEKGEKKNLELDMITDKNATQSTCAKKTAFNFRQPKQMYQVDV